MLDAARVVIAGAAEWGDVDTELADPIADSVVAALRPWMAFEFTVEHLARVVVALAGYLDDRAVSEDVQDCIDWAKDLVGPLGGGDS